MDLSRIPPAPKGARAVDFKQTLDAAKLDLAVGIMSIAGPLVVEGRLEYTEGEILLDANVRGSKRFECSRCLELIEKTFVKDVTLAFEPAGEPINALPELGEEIMVDAPIHALCKEDCKGLCERCGANLNLGPCRCPERPNN